VLYGRRLDEALEQVDGSRYALVHAVSKRARQITLWLTADPAELRAEAAPPPAPGELATRDPVALAEAEILNGEVIVRWDPDGRAEELELTEATILDTDPLLLDGIGDEDEIDLGDEGEASVIVAADDADEGEEAEADDAEDSPEAEVGVTEVEGLDLDDVVDLEDDEAVADVDDELEGASLEAMAEEEAALDEELDEEM